MRNSCMCKASNCATTTPIGSTINYSSTELLNLLGGNVFTIPIYFKTVTGQNLSAGTYNVTLNLTINWNICGLLGIGSICLNPQVGSTTLSPVVSLIVTNDCSTISAPNINFGSAPLVSSFPNVYREVIYLILTGIGGIWREFVGFLRLRADLCI
ncbi:Csu type fimbrial protein [Arsenophonus sp. PmNCSU2021_1]|uniref:Csu type fimbrial protein n=1 Tax=Arsenophonus sp. PmNCSU2021_1 TaxID=3118989 RepID=UPI002FF06BF6